MDKGSVCVCFVKNNESLKINLANRKCVYGTVVQFFFPTAFVDGMIKNKRKMYPAYVYGTACTNMCINDASKVLGGNIMFSCGANTYV